MDIINVLKDEFKIGDEYVRNTVELLKDNTIPFIARYRKEATGGMTDVVLREFSERLDYLYKLEEKQEDTIRLIDEQGKLTDDLKLRILEAKSIKEVDDLYRPYKPKKETRASIARAKGLENIALVFKLGMEDEVAFRAQARKLIDEEKELFDEESVISGVKDIIAEDLSDDIDVRNFVKNSITDHGQISSKLVEENKNEIYENYFDFTEAIKRIPNHRVLALNRGEKEKVLKVSIEIDHEAEIKSLGLKFIPGSHKIKGLYEEIVEDAYKRLIFPSIEREIRSDLTERAQEDAIKVFALNLEPLLMSPPIKGKRVMAIDPGIRTGSKIAVIDDTGKVLGFAVLMLTAGGKSSEKDRDKLAAIAKKFNIDIIAIGNGTASRETEQLVASMIQSGQLDLKYIIVSEAGASVYSASKVGVEEFPNLDVSIRGAVSIGRRLQDPLAELVKIEPKHIGVGQYQHDLDQKKLETALSGVVEDCVNRVGVDLNTASPSLLSYVAGINKRSANEIIKYREEFGKYRTREDLKKVKGLGPKTFTQCAGFLRIPDSENELDRTAVHPESYSIAKEIIGMDYDNIDISSVSEKLGVGKMTLKDIIEELKKPGRDPRDEVPKPILRQDVLSLDDLEMGMELKGTVRNVVDFGAFVDIGLKNDGLIHISEMSNSYVSHPKDVVSVGDIVDVKIIGIDHAKSRVALSMKKKNKEVKK